MPWYKIRHNAGYGDTVELEQCDNDDTAVNVAYNNWKDEAENNADYSATELTRDDVIEEGYAPEDYGFDPLSEDET